MPQTLTLRQVRETFWDKISDKILSTATADEKLRVDGVINQVQERFITQGKWRGTVVRARFPVYDRQITLPNSLESVLRYAPVWDDGSICWQGSAWNVWHSIIGTDQDGVPQPHRATDLGDGWPTFRDSPYPLFYIKAQSEQSEAGNATILLRGLDSMGRQIYSGTGTEGVSLQVSSTPHTTTQVFRALSYWVKSGFTKGVVRLYAVDIDTDAAAMIAIIVPGKLVSNYRRYAIPVCDEPHPTVDCLCKRAYVPARADNDPIIPSNMGALKLGLMSLQFEDRNDFERASQTMQLAIDLLDQERQEHDGDSMPTIRFAPDFGASGIPNLV